MSITRITSRATQCKTHSETSRAFDALASSRDEARRLELILFAADRCSTAGLLVAQLHLQFANLQQGIAVSRSDLLALLEAATRVPRGQS